MAGKKPLLFVVNPISGGKSKQRVPALINTYLNHAIYSYEVYAWEIIDDLPKTIESFTKKDGYAIVALGGDGTINAVASCLINSSFFTKFIRAFFSISSGTLYSLLGSTLSLK